MTRIPALLILAIVVSSSGCRSWHDWQRQKAIERSRAQALSKIDQADCKARGGAIEGVGMFGTPACVVPYADAGKRCTDSDDCQGFCKGPEGIAAGTPATGRCSLNSADHFGCSSVVRNGLAGETLCAD